MSGLFLWIVAGFPATAQENPVALSGMMQPGMVFQDLMYPLPADADAERGILTAARAKIGVPPNLLRIDGLHFSRGALNQRFDLRATSAVYDLKTGYIRTQAGFQGQSGGFCFKGSKLQGETKSMNFEMAGHLEIQMTGLMPGRFASSGPRPRPSSSFDFHSLRLTCLQPIESMTSLDLVQKFSCNLATFVKCWNWVENPDHYRSIRPSGDFALICPVGGWLDLRHNDLQLAGRSAVLGPDSVLASNDGIRWFQEESDGKAMIHVTGRGGIKTWMHPPRSDETWICSKSFDYVSDGGILQFEGGPVVLKRKGVILEATECWQFIRIFGGQRIVLSPGSWNSTGTLGDFSK